MPEIVVAIPVRNEAVLIGDCLRALALQQGTTPIDVLLLVNNSSDGTADIARALCPTLPCRLHVAEHDFAPAEANAGNARRLAMAKAAALADVDGVIMTTDADGMVAPDWIETNLVGLEAGADVVCGRATIDPLDALQIPQHLHDDDAREVAYGGLLDRISCLLDPDPFDPWPRHAEESGASIAVRRSVFLSAGGVPCVNAGEDRALVAALRRVDARVRHDPNVHVTVSGRTVGRASGGMAETIRRRMHRQDPTLDDALEPVADRVRRLGARRLLRLAWADRTNRATLLRHLAVELDLPVAQMEKWLNLSYFGAAWALAEGASRVLTRRPVPRNLVAAQSHVAEGVLSTLAQSKVISREQGILF